MNKPPYSYVILTNEGRAIVEAGDPYSRPLSGKGLGQGLAIGAIEKAIEDGDIVRAGTYFVAVVGTGISTQKANLYVVNVANQGLRVVGCHDHDF